MSDLTLTLIAYRVEILRDHMIAFKAPRRQRQALRLARKRRRGRAGQRWDRGALADVRRTLTGPSLMDVLAAQMRVALHRQQMRAIFALGMTLPDPFSPLDGSA